MARRMLEKARISVSLPPELVRYADRRASELGLSRSQLISQAVAELREREAEQLAREGYSFYATEAESFAAVSLSAVSEAIEHGR